MIRTTWLLLFNLVFRSGLLHLYGIAGGSGGGDGEVGLGARAYGLATLMEWEEREAALRRARDEETRRDHDDHDDGRDETSEKLFEPYASLARARAVAARERAALQAEAARAAKRRAAKERGSEGSVGTGEDRSGEDLEPYVLEEGEDGPLHGAGGPDDTDPLDADFDDLDDLDAVLHEEDPSSDKKDAALAQQLAKIRRLESLLEQSLHRFLPQYDPASSLHSDLLAIFADQLVYLHDTASLAIFVRHFFLLNNKSRLEKVSHLLSSCRLLQKCAADEFAERLNFMFAKKMDCFENVVKVKMLPALLLRKLIGRLESTPLLAEDLSCCQVGRVARIYVGGGSVLSGGKSLLCWRRNPPPT